MRISVAQVSAVYRVFGPNPAGLINVNGSKFSPYLSDDSGKIPAIDLAAATDFNRLDFS